MMTCNLKERFFVFSLVNLFLFSAVFGLSVLDTGEIINCTRGTSAQKDITILNEADVSISVRVDVNAALPTENRSALRRLVRVTTPDIEIGPKTEYEIEALIVPEKTIPTGSYTYWLEIKQPAVNGYETNAVPVKILVD